jgi:hypothetical protein
MASRSTRSQTASIAGTARTAAVTPSAPEPPSLDPTPESSLNPPLPTPDPFQRLEALIGNLNARFVDFESRMTIPPVSEQHPRGPIQPRDSPLSINDDDDDAPGPALSVPPFGQPHRRRRDRSPTPTIYSMSSPPLPPEFSGQDVTEFRAFWNQCNLSFRVAPAHFQDDESKVMFVLSRLRGEASNSTMHIQEDPDNDLRHDFGAFQMFMKELYVDYNFIDSCSEKLLRLRQTKSALDYASKFKTLMASLNYDEKAQMDLFYAGLQPRVRESVAVHGKPDNFRNLVQLAVRIDAAQYDARFRVSNTRNPSSSGSNAGSRAPSASATTPGPSDRSGMSPTPRPSRISDEEKQRRRDNKLCMYCAAPDHFFGNCPNKKPRRSGKTPQPPVVHAVVSTPTGTSTSTPAPPYQPKSENSHAQASKRSQA